MTTTTTTTTTTFGLPLLLRSRKPSPKSQPLLLLLRGPTLAPRISRRSFQCQAAGEPTTTSDVLYQGVYGPWKIESSDVQEVILYRSGLVTAASSFVIASSTALLQHDITGSAAVLDLIRGNLDLFYGLGACGLGLSLYLIHIYVSEIKRALQALWVLGALGSLGTYAALAQPEGKSLVEYVVQNPTAVWLVGPLFAALTGLVFKEGMVKH